VDRAVEAAVDGLTQWSTLTVHERAALLLDAATALEPG
jgi:acyl-CoA reductase-like NAD-dependent aldehyde dehydrogenase